jgi:hypothetical protein
MDEPGEPKRKWGIIPTDIGALRAKVRGFAERSGSSDVVLRAVVERADRILQRLEGTSEVLEKAARIELRILEKLEPIVDDLGQLVRVQLAQALGRPVREGDGSRAKGRDAGRDKDEDDDIIDVTEVTEVTDPPETTGAPGPTRR